MIQSRNIMALVCSALLLYVSTAVNAEIKKTLYFDLPAQNLQEALIEFGTQANISIIADDALIRNLRSSPTIGKQTAKHAIDRLLASSPLEAIYVEKAHAFVLTPKTAHEGPLISARKQSEALVEEVLSIGTILPYRYNNIGYSQVQGNVAYFDSSRFVNSVSNTLIEDIQANDIEQALRYTSSISPGDGIADTNDDFYIRGFQRKNIFYDGFRLSSNTGVKVSAETIDRMSILKGPSTLLYGQSQPGGLVNIVKKQPEKIDFLNLKLRLGSFGKHDLALDWNKSLSTDLDFRLIMENQNQAELGEQNDIEKRLLSSSLTWQVSEDTSVTTGYEFLYLNQTPNLDFEVFRAVEGFTPRVTLEQLSFHNRDDFESQFNLANIEVDHYFNDLWRLNAKSFLHKEFRYGIRPTQEQQLKTQLLFDKSELGQDFLLLIPGGTIALPILVDSVSPEWIYSIGPIRSLYAEDAEDTSGQVNVQLLGDTYIHGVNHRFNLGFDFYSISSMQKYIVENRRQFIGQEWTETAFVNQLDNIFNTLTSPNRPLGIFEEFNYESYYTDTGFYVKDNIAWSDKWITSLGLRYTATQGEQGLKDQLVELPNYSVLSPQLGLVFKACDNHSLFASYSEGMQTNYYIDDVNTQINDPELSQQFEIGIKSHWLDGKLLSSTAIYYIAKENVVDIATIEGLRTALLQNDQLVTGIDSDLTWQASDALNIVAAASLISAEIDSGINQGNTPQLAPNKTLSLLAHFDVSTSLQALAGFNHVGQRYADNENLFELKGYTTFNIGSTYHWDTANHPMYFQFAINNLFDKEYQTAAIGGVRKNSALGRSLVATLTLEL